MGSPKWSRRVLVLMMLLKTFTSIWATEVCSNTILPGSKGDQGERGDEGDQGRLGKAGPPGQRGSRGELGSQGDLGQMGKVGPAGEKGVKGLQGAHGPSGLKGKSGSTCDCGRYRKVVGQLDINISKLKNAVKFLKNVILGIQETEEKFYLIVKEARKFKEAQMNCKLRGGALATPETEDTNSLIAKYVAQAGLTHVFIGQRVQGQEGADLGVSHPQNYTAWAPGEPREPTTKDGCVQMSSTGAWSQSECDATMYYVCEFLKRKRGPLSVQ
ncbi:collectin-10 [Conger conger]|uniref:collectin-10 n=1 Tax=Conger conger TaxID=82655 RepID=UPI002A5A09D0|nr:collectin-10 [Conger conger]